MGEMIESFTIIVVLGFSVWWNLNQRREAHLTNLDWIVSALRLRRDILETKGDERRAEDVAAIADALSSGAGVISLKIAISDAQKREVERAAMTASNDNWLSPLGVIQGTPAYASSKAALYWLGRKMRSER